MSVKTKRAADEFGDPGNNGLVNICNHGGRCEAGRCQKLERVEIPGRRINARPRDFRDSRRYEGETRDRIRSESMAERRFQSTKLNRYKTFRVCNATCSDMHKCSGDVEKTA